MLLLFPWCVRHEHETKRERFEKDSFQLSIFHFHPLSLQPYPPSNSMRPPSSPLNKFHVRTCYPFRNKKKVARAICVSKANRDEHNKSLVAQNFLVFETCREVGRVGGRSLCFRCVLWKYPPVEALKWSLGRKTYIEKTLLGINVNNCNILSSVLRITSSPCCLLSPVNFSWVALLLLRCYISRLHSNSDLMTNFSFRWLTWRSTWEYLNATWAVHNAHCHMNCMTSSLAWCLLAVQISFQNYLLQ